MYAARLAPKNSPPGFHPRPSYKVPYILPSSVYSNPFVFTLFSKLPGCTSFFPNRNSLQAPLYCALPPLCFQRLPTIKFINSFLLTTMQIARGVWGTPGGAGVKVILELLRRHTAQLTETTGRGRLAGNSGAGQDRPGAEPPSHKKPGGREWLLFTRFGCRFCCRR